MDFGDTHQAWIIIGASIIILVVLYNTFLVKRNEVKKAFSTMDVMFKRRFDLMPNLVQAVKMFMEHEKEIFERITQLRSTIFDDKSSNEEKIMADDEASKIVRKINFTAENYPDLKSNTNLLQAQMALKECEDEISAARRLYNANVTAYNNVTGFFPLNIFALIMGFRKYKLFEATTQERENQEWFK